MTQTAIPSIAAVTVTYLCPDCDGAGYIHDGEYCRRCYQHFNPDEITIEQLSSGKLPCGCSTINLRDYKTCPECEGEGKISRQMTLEELATRLCIGR